MSARGASKGNRNAPKETRSRGAQPGNQNADKGRETLFHVKTSHAFKGASKAAAPRGDLTEVIHLALDEWIRKHRPDVVERFPDAFRDE